MRGPARILALAALIVGTTTTSAHAEELNVPWTVAGALAAQGQAANGSPAGSNDWECEPSKRHPNPVVLVHGLFANRTANFPTISPFLANRGFCVFALTYGTRDAVNLGVYQPGGLNRMQESARELKRFVRRVLDATGSEHVDIVGHSEGSLMPNYYVRFLGGAGTVDHYVGLTPLWDGTNAAGLATLAQMGEALGITGLTYQALKPFCESCPQFLHGSPFMHKMSSGGGPAEPGVDYTMIMTRNDELVIPWQSGFIDGARNHVVQERCALDQAEHLSVAFDPVTAHLIWNALEPPGRQHNVPCVPVLPLVGAATYSGN
jgi:triacylglycerol lipase